MGPACPHDMRSSQAPANQVGKIARAFKDEQRGRLSSAGAEAASKVHVTHGERDSHKIFRKFGLSLKVPVSELQVEGEGGPLLIPHLKIRDFAALLIRRHPRLLLGGHRLGEGSQRICMQFWQKFKLHQPCHEIYQAFPSQEEWKRVIPICLHGDKGRGRAKLPFFVFSFEACFGLPKDLREAGPCFKTHAVHGNRLSWSCRKRKRDLCPNLNEPQEAGDACCMQDLAANDGQDMLHNGRGHSFLSKFLCAAIPAKTFKNNPAVVPAMLRQMRDCLISLFKDGYVHEGECYRFALAGVKGDLEFHHEVANFTRTYVHAGFKNPKEMCPECLAGGPLHPYTDVRQNPSWSSTLYASEPWVSRPILNEVPFSRQKPAALYRRDPFHTLKFGFLKDLGASVLVELSWLGIFDTDDASESHALPCRLQRAWSYFKLWTIAEKKHPTIRTFSLGTLHRTKASNFPFLGGKGADSVMVLMFLEFFIDLKAAQVQDQDVSRKMDAMLETIKGALHFVGIHHTHRLFLDPYCADLLWQSGARLLRGYALLANDSIQMQRRLYSLRPKVHYFHHILYDLQLQLAAGHSSILNPIIFGCEGNEDFIGRVSRLSRKVSPRLASRRTIDRYLLACKLLYRKHGV